VPGGYAPVPDNPAPADPAPPPQGEPAPQEPQPDTTTCGPPPAGDPNFPTYGVPGGWGPASGGPACPTGHGGGSGGASVRDSPSQQGSLPFPPPPASGPQESTASHHKGVPAPGDPDFGSYGVPGGWGPGNRKRWNLRKSFGRRLHGNTTGDRE
ncbi:hypothetical protein FGRMN_11264, partial [Fusarium graminum]